VSRLPRPSDLIKKQFDGVENRQQGTTRPTERCEQKKCKLYGKLPVPASIPIKDAELVCLGEAPGQFEDIKGIPFVGQSGQLLRRELRVLGLDDTQICFTNVVHCRPPGNADPDPATQSYCMEQHKEEWEELLNHKVVIVLGGIAAKAVAGARSIGSVRGTVKKIGDSVFLFLWHPSYVCRSPNAIHQWRRELRQVLKLLSRGAPTRDSIPFTVVKTCRELDEFISLARDAEWLAFDLETTGLDPWESGARILCMSIATESECCVIPLEHREAPEFCSSNLLVSKLQHLFNGKAKKVAINAKFDMLWLRVKYGVRVEGFYIDPQAAQHLLNEGVQQSTALKSLVWQYFPEEGGYEEDLIGGDYSNLEEKDTEKLFKYCALDSIFALRLVSEVEEKLKEKGMMFLYREIMNPTISTLTDIEVNGLCLDFGVLDAKQRELQARVDSLLRQLRADPMIEDDERETFSFNSLPQLKKVLIDRYHMPVISRTARGQPQLTADILENYASRGCDFARRLIEYRRTVKTLNTYLKNFAEKNVDGLVHGSYGFFTSGGRLNSSNPNMQNLPYEVRDCFRSRFEGGKLVQLDFSQMEMAVMAYASGDPQLKAAFEAGRDIHAETAARIKSIREGREYKAEEMEGTEERRIAKAVNFALIYGGSPYTVQESTGISLADAEEFMSHYFRVFRGVRAYQDGIRNRIRAGNKVIENFFGRRRNLQGYEEADAIRKAFNFPIQSTASDLNLIVLNEIAEYLRVNGLKSLLVATVHDSIVVDAPPEEVEEIVQLMKQAPESLQFDFMSFPLRVDISIGERWGSLEEVEFHG